MLIIAKRAILHFQLNNQAVLRQHAAGQCQGAANAHPSSTCHQKQSTGIQKDLDWHKKIRFKNNSAFTTKTLVLPQMQLPFMCAVYFGTV